VRAAVPKIQRQWRRHRSRRAMLHMIACRARWRRNRLGRAFAKLQRKAGTFCAKRRNKRMMQMGLQLWLLSLHLRYVHKKPTASEIRTLQTKVVVQFRSACVDEWLTLVCPSVWPPGVCFRSMKLVGVSNAAGSSTSCRSQRASDGLAFEERLACVSCLWPSS
jgi:hypothetical protein